MYAEPDIVKLYFWHKWWIRESSGHFGIFVIMITIVVMVMMFLWLMTPKRSITMTEKDKNEPNYDFFQATAVSDLTTVKACLSDPSVSLLCPIIIKPKIAQTPNMWPLFHPPQNKPLGRHLLAQQRTALHRRCHQCWSSSARHQHAPPYKLMSTLWRPVSPL